MTAIGVALIAARLWARRATGLLLQAAVTVVAVGLVGVVLGSYFGTADGVWFGLVGAAPVGAVCALAVARRPVAVLAAGYVAGFIVVAAVVLRPEGALWQSPTVVVKDVWHGWDRMLSVNLPADPLPELLTLPTLVSWTAAFAGVATAMRSARPLAPLVPVLAAHLVALLLVAGLHTDHVVPTAALALCLGALARLRVGPAVAGPGASSTLPAGGRRGTRTVHAAAALVVVAGAIGAGTLGALGAATVLPSRFDPRTVDPPPVAVRPSVTPLTLVTTQLRRPSKPLFHVRVRSDAPVDRVRTAVLDTYDGTTWSTSAHFLVAGRVLPAVSSDARGRAATMTVLLDTWQSPFLPVLGSPTGLTGSEVSGIRAGYDRGTQTLVWSGPTPRGTTYAVTAVVPTVDDGLRSDVAAARDALDAPPADVPAALRSVADTELDGPGPPLERLRRLETFLRSRPYDPAAPAGHSFAALEQLAVAPATAGVGNEEQHAAAFALLARLAGFPSRVAVGYRLPAAGADGVIHVTTHDARAWPEIRFTGYGWVPFEPTDPMMRPPDSPPVAESAAVPAPPPLPAAQPVAPPVVPPVVDPPDPGGAGAFLPLAVVVLLGGTALSAAAIVGAKVLRRAVRRRGLAPVRLRGAWAEAVDTVTDRAFLGHPDRRLVITPALTPEEIALRTEAAFGLAARPLAVLATMITASAFGDVAVRNADADRAWQIVETLRRTLVGGPHGLRTAVRIAVDPRSLVRPRISRRRARRALRSLGLATS